MGTSFNIKTRRNSRFLRSFSWFWWFCSLNQCDFLPAHTRKPTKISFVAHTWRERVRARDPVRRYVPREREFRRAVARGRQPIGRYSSGTHCIYIVYNISESGEKLVKHERDYDLSRSRTLTLKSSDTFGGKLLENQGQRSMGRVEPTFYEAPRGSSTHVPGAANRPPLHS